MRTRAAIAADAQIVFIIDLVLAGGGKAALVVIEDGIARTTGHSARLRVAVGVIFAVLRGRQGFARLPFAAVGDFRRMGRER
ncbi:hypothetical protein D3C81_1820500 [compost metagenome]